MQRGFTKLFNTIVTSTIWREDNETRILWITMLAISDRFGEVSGSVPGMAAIANISEEGCRRAITKLESPDPDSRTSDDEGRRIRKIEGGWHITNYEKYRALLTHEERKEYKRIKQRQYRAKAPNVDNCGQLLNNVERGGHCGHSTDADADANKEKISILTEKVLNSASESASPAPEQWEQFSAWCFSKGGEPTKRGFKTWQQTQANKHKGYVLHGKFLTARAANEKCKSNPELISKMRPATRLNGKITVTKNDPE